MDVSGASKCQLTPMELLYMSAPNPLRVFLGCFGDTFVFPAKMHTLEFQSGVTLKYQHPCWLLVSINTALTPINVGM